MKSCRERNVNAIAVEKRRETLNKKNSIRRPPFRTEPRVKKLGKMSSAEDADDERESRLHTPVAEWVDKRTQKFTLFVMLPQGDVCTLRELPSGISVFDVKGRLELSAGIPCQIYALIYPDGEEMEENQKLHVHENITHGYLLKMQLHDNWESLYTSLVRNNIEHVNHGGGVHLRGNISVGAEESDRYEAMVKERGAVALYMAAALGLQRMVGMLISVGVNVNSATPFGRTPLHAAASRDNLAVLDLLINNGGAVKQTDFFGVTALDIARAMSSSLCAKRLRLLQLNLRGNVLSSAKGRVLRKRTQSHVNKIDSYGSGEFTPETERAKSTFSQYSEDSVFKHELQSPLHRNRKLISSSAPVSENIRTSQKRGVRWKEPPKDGSARSIRDMHTGSSATVDTMVDVKRLNLNQQRTVLKFDSGTKKDTSATQTEKTKEEIEAQTSVEAAAKKTKSRLKYYKKLADNMATHRTMRRKINISAANSRPQGGANNSEAFTQWLEKKDVEVENLRYESDSGESINPTDDEEDDKMFEFNKRVRKQNKPKNKSMTPGNRPIKDLISVGSTTPGESLIPSPYLHANAYWEWKRSRSSGQMTSQPRSYRSDVSDEKRRLEEKRQMLLLSAISYDEWMDHVEDRKTLIKHILQADSAEIEKIEKEKTKDRERKERIFSYEVWKDKIKERNIEEKKRRDTQRRYDEANKLEKLEFGKSSAAVQFEAWVERKRHEMQRAKETNVGKAGNKKHRAGPAEVESAYQTWLVKKHGDDMSSIGKQIEKERELLGAMRQMRASTIAT